MNLSFILILSILILGGCGKKSDPLYQGKIKYEIKVVS